MEAIKKQIEEPVLAVVSDETTNEEKVLFCDPDLLEYQVTEENKFDVLSQMIAEKYSIEPELKKLKNRNESLKKMISLVLKYVGVEDYFDIKIGLGAKLTKIKYMVFNKEEFDKKYPDVYDQFKTIEQVSEKISIKTSKGTKGARFDESLLKQNN